MYFDIGESDRLTFLFHMSSIESFAVLYIMVVCLLSVHFDSTYFAVSAFLANKYIILLYRPVFITNL